MDQPMTIRRRNVLVTPRRMPFGSMEGMGDIDPETGIMTFDTPSSQGADPGGEAGPAAPPKLAVTPTGAASTAQQKQAAAAGSSVWDSVSSLFGAVGKVAPAIMQTKAAQAVINATNKLAGKQVVGATVVTPWYTNPFVIGAGLLVLGGGTYIAMKSRPGTSGRRRR